ncbi:MAG: hypothetical protein IIA87_05610 [Nanoarchaeota archaeon]|nr:hypothetical protein [Nanoarchaeota archaeon]
MDFQLGTDEFSIIRPEDDKKVEVKFPWSINAAIRDSLHYTAAHEIMSRDQTINAYINGSCMVLMPHGISEWVIPYRVSEEKYAELLQKETREADFY